MSGASLVRVLSGGLDSDGGGSALWSGEKLKILQALVGKLLTLASTRELIEECVEEQRAARQDLREIRAEQHRRQREEAALR